MITKKKKYTLYYVMALACGLVASFFIYSCSADGYYSDEIEKNEVTNTRALSSKMINNGSTLIDSIASSDEFWEFEMSSELLADKFHEYTSILSEEEYDKLMENLNDDDRMYLRTVLKIGSVYAAVLNHQEYEMPQNASDLDINRNRLNNLLCRLTRRYLTVPKTENTNWFRISPNGYSYKDGAMRIVCRMPRKRISIPLKRSPQSQ